MERSKKGEKNLWEAMLEFLDESGIDLSFQEYFRSWPVVAGARLSSCTKLASLKDLDCGRIYVTPSSLSAKSLLKMEEKAVIERWNERFPDKKIKKITVLKAKP